MRKNSYEYSCVIDDVPCLLSNINIKINVHAFLARTEIVMVFENGFDEEKEGEVKHPFFIQPAFYLTSLFFFSCSLLQLVFPLPDEALLCGYAVDIGGNMVDAVVVEKEKARVVFETEERVIAKERSQFNFTPTMENTSVSFSVYLLSFFLAFHLIFFFLRAEKVIGNVFRTRVFPFPKKGFSTIFFLSLFLSCCVKARERCE